MNAVEAATRDQWFCLGRACDAPEGGAAPTRLLGEDVTVGLRDGAADVRDARGRAMAAQVAYGHVWACPGTPARPLFALPEYGEPDRSRALCGAVRVRASGLRLVENFLDMAHFPFVHTDILGAEDRPEVPRYKVELREEVDEVWATECLFWQPQAAAHAEGGQMTDYQYRVATPFNVLLYKTCPSDPVRMDVIALFVQPMEADLSLAHPLVAVIDPVSDATALTHFQQLIFLQDRAILENQRPRLLPLTPNMETPTRADLTSVVYRRWLKAKGVRFGVFEAAEAAA